MPDQARRPVKGGLLHLPKQTRQHPPQVKPPTASPDDEEKIKEDLNHIKDLLNGMRSYLKK